MPLFPDNINRFIDLFCGGGNIGVNIKANQIVCNDIQKEVVEFLGECKKLSSQEMLHILKNTINTYQLSKTNREGYLQIRSDYNNGNRTWDMFYAMVTNAFNYSIRFNSKNEFNIAFGKDRSYFSPELEKKFIKFVDHVKNKDIRFINKDFRSLPLNKLNCNDFVYADPPYFITDANYNENGLWTIKHENDLLKLLDDLNDKGIKFALSNVLEHKGKSHDLLKEWSQKYIINQLKYNYGNANYQTKDKSKNSSLEVLITNYRPQDIVSNAC